jgi:SAM-dependent methyltransferase
VSRHLSGLPGVAEVVGVDPSEVFVDRARELGAGRDNLRFEVGDARSLSFDEGSFDAVVFHTVLSHVPEPERAIAEARRVTTAGGSLAAFDGDYATTTVAISATDPLQACADAAMMALVHDRHLVRRLPVLVTAAGWEVLAVRSHGYLETDRPSYMLTLVDRGADALVAAGELGERAAAGLKEEARRRVDDGRFFGHIAYASVIARAG